MTGSRSWVDGARPNWSRRREAAMNRAELIAALAAFETAAAVFREELESQARHELDANGVKVDWKMPEATVWASVTQGAVSVHDEAAFLKWMKLRHPDQVETV